MTISKITKEEMAARLYGREYGNEITREEEELAKQNGLFVIFGYSDDNLEIRGLDYDELGCYNGGTFLIDKHGILPTNRLEDLDAESEEEVRDFLKRKDLAHELRAIWCDTDDLPPWSYSIDVPHASFNIYEDGELFCIGIVLAVEDLA